LLDFSSLVVGEEYDRPYLARLWKYESYHALARGVVTPRGEKVIILFVTREKQEHQTQYEDHIEHDILFWEGEKGHGTDERIAAGRDTIHVFFRERHHSPFVYEGKAIFHNIRRHANRPSQFVFQLVDRKVTTKDLIEEVRSSATLSDLEKKAIIKSRRGQGIFRQRSIELWKTCSVTGFTRREILIASHIKPWKVADNRERLDEYNSLLLVPTLDKLFDRGYIGFEPTGRIMISRRISKPDLQRIGVDNALRLRDVPEETRKYLEYHCEYRFDFVAK